MLVITGKPEDVERYKKLRGVQNGIDPSTGQPVSYGGLKKFGPDAAKTLGENNPWLKYGPDYRVAMAQLHCKALPAGKKGYGEDDRVEIYGIANANIVDRYDERLAPEGVITTDFNKNPVLLVDHMYATRAVVGRVTNITPEHDGVKFEGFVGDPGAVGGIQNLTEVQRDTRSLVAQGLVQTVSVGFIPKKIRAPAYDDNGQLVEPAVIEQWQLLELSIVAIPANAGSTFEMKQYAYALSLNDTADGNVKSGNTELTMPPSSVKNGDTNNDLKGEKGTEVQTLIFDKEKFEKEECIDWAKEHGYKADKVDDADGTYRLRQRDPKDFDQDTFKTIELTEGVEAVVGRLLEEGDEKMTEEQFRQMMEGLQGIKQSVTDGLKEIHDQNEKILGKVAGKGEGEDDEDEDDEEMEKALQKQAERIEAIEKSLGQMDTVIGKIFEKINA